MVYLVFTRVLYNSDTLEEILIMELRDRPCLWDHRIDVRLRNSDCLKTAWDELSAILGLIYISIKICLNSFCDKRFI